MERRADTGARAAAPVVEPEDAGALFDRLYSEFAPRVRGLVRRLIADDQRVDDIVQETFLRAYGGRIHLEYLDADADRSQWPWLAAVARNLALDVLRRGGRVFEHELDEEIVLAEPAGSDPEHQLLMARRREGITAALDAVSPRQRRMLVLKHVDGWTYERLARDEGISIEALKSALARARRTFRSAYAVIAEERGLGVFVGGLVHRARARFRGLRDRVMGAVPEAVVHAASTAPAAMNALTTAALLGAVALSGGAFGGEQPHPAAPLQRAAAAVDAVVTEADRVAAVSQPEEAPDVALESAAPVSVDSAPPPESGASPGGETPPPVHVDSDDVVPPDQSPAHVDGDVEHGDSGVDLNLDHSADLDGDGDNETSDGHGHAGFDCPPPDERGEVTAIACPLVEEAPDLPL